MRRPRAFRLLRRHGLRILSWRSVDHVLTMELGRCLVERTKWLFVGEICFRAGIVLFILILKLLNRIYSREVIIDIGKSVTNKVQATLKACPNSLIRRLLIPRPAFTNLVIVSFHEGAHIIPLIINSILMSMMTVYRVLQVPTFALSSHQSCLFFIFDSVVEGLELLLSLPPLRNLRISFSMNYCRLKRWRYLGVVCGCYIGGR